GVSAVAGEAGREVLLDILGCGGLGLCGPGAAGFARAVLVGLLSGGGLLHTRLILTRPAAEELLPGRSEELARVPGVEVVDHPGGLYTAAEAETFTRSRLFAEADT